MQTISVRDLSKSYRVYRKREGLLASVGGIFKREHRTVNAVQEISFSIDAGEMVAFLGPNGAGKTTTLKLLSGLITPTSGTATVLGHVPWKREHAYRRRFSLVMGQKNQLWWDLPAQESFRLHQEIYRIDPHAFEERLEELTSLLEVTDLIGQPVRELSLGERMRMELIAALLHAPEVLLLDEPTIGLDVVSQRTVQQFLKKYQAEREITVILTSHYMKDVEALCERAIVINEGEIKHDGPLVDLVDRFSKHKIVDVLFADTVPPDIEQYGTLIKSTPPRARLEVARAEVPEVLSAILSRYVIEDIAVNERPLEDVIAEMFTTDKAEKRQAEEVPFEV
ncbi:ABC transporter ATP-binding protein [Calycomorphotria hydatis]|uniref:Putative ABC transporter ATP-binding protein YbhF n=1 Tax=Calycomorphotria hydatis TaxID=2528027 RepID=A0A517TD24_9PLAN|nr:ABC transporter ATP-binding protein [Calycomorphotria hydatis]QDT66272.1 putative ABC transporter ATP-binding protein YbhF [Calycomorphotria hydatis]